MEFQNNKLVYRGSLMDVYALQEFLTEQEIVSVVFDPSATNAAAGIASPDLGVQELYVNALDFDEALKLKELFFQD